MALLVLIIRCIDEGSAPVAQLQDHAAVRVMPRDGFHLDLTDLHALRKRMDLKCRLKLTQPQRPKGRGEDPVKQGGSLLTGSAEGHIQTCPFLFSRQDGKHAQTNQMIEMQVTQQDDR